ncbi:hypothetical protein SAMN04489812_1725 [Microlunatus soli]|uniref:Uncharacterized protein n=1 Tax=Microlunatus soli TaxID=630515 RepID=A0A1H1RPL9_9ACTN|nr:hypothetical protein SAMN04489812_1725 [Microlunatus soli]
MAGLVSLIVIAGCSQPEREPGLFGRDTPPPSPTIAASAPTTSPRPHPQVVNPRLPVLGERVWTTGDGSRISFRIAVHGLRRISGGTVLDWSITPLPSAGLRPGDAVPETVDLAAASDPRTFRVIDTDARQVYRPLVDPEGRHCLCTADHPLRVEVTSVRQVTFPELPDPNGAAPFDVDIPSVALFTGIWAPAPGFAVAADRGTDLSGPAHADSVIHWTRSFRYGPSRSGQLMRIGIIGVTTSPGSTSMVWSIWTISSGSGLSAGRAGPVTADTDSRTGRDVASGPRLRYSTSSRHHRTLSPWREGGRDGPCLCSDLGGWTAGMATARRSITVITNLPALPAGVTSVDVLFPGLQAVRRVEVTRVRQPALDTGGWHAWRHWPPANDRPPARGVGDWPTPLPTEEMVRRTVVTVRPLS